MNKSIEDAVRFISAELKQNAEADRSKLVNTASQKYDLDPMQTQFLIKRFVYKYDQRTT